jgi:hypothetical protein
MPIRETYMRVKIIPPRAGEQLGTGRLAVISEASGGW